MDRNALKELMQAREQRKNKKAPGDGAGPAAATKRSRAVLTGPARPVLPTKTLAAFTTPADAPASIAGPADQWACAVCTLDNPTSASACGACDTPKVDAFSKGTLTVVSFNIAECIPSSKASKGFDAATAIATAVLAQDPDVIALQEAPRGSWATTVFEGYVSMGATPTHCGYAVLLLKKALATRATPLKLSMVGGQRLPAVAAVISPPLSSPGAPSLTVSSSHLEPFKDGAPLRLQQFAALVGQTPAGPCVHAGDFNARKAEDSKFEKLGLTDCWKDAGSIKAEGTTWDSNTNLYHRDGFGFSCRFDRIYSRGGLTTEAFSVAFNTPVQGTAGWYLSDHYGLVATLSLPGQCVRE